MPDEKEKSKPLTKAQEIRKTTKPIMEKRRRARINASLCELKALLLDVMKKEGARTNKMEKADILEMTVKHLRTVQRHQFEAAAVTDPTVFNKYQSGFNECATEVSRYLGTVDGIDAELRSRLLNHLANCVTSIDSSVHARATPPATAHVRPMQIPQQHNTSMSPPLSVGAIKPTAAVPIMTLPEINNNVLPGMHGLTVVGNTYKTPDMSAQKVSEERLKSADVAAFVIPSNILSGGQMPGYIIPLYSGQAGKLVQNQEGNNNVPASFSLPTVVPVPINLQHSPPRTHAPQSPNTDSKGMDLTTDNRHKTDKFTYKVEESALRNEHIDIKVPIAVPAQRSVAPAANEPMWRPW